MLSKSLLVPAALLMASPAIGTQQAATKVAPKETTYCLQLEPLTGSRISHTECRTKKEWELLGVDVDDLPTK